jgi:uracil phosphoribosyltransferase
MKWRVSQRKSTIMTVKQVSHPLYLHKLSLLRDARVRPKQFRELVDELSILVGVIATETLDITTTQDQNSPVGPYLGMKLKDRVGIFPVLRAGHGMINGNETISTDFFGAFI